MNVMRVDPAIGALTLSIAFILGQWNGRARAERAAAEAVDPIIMAEERLEFVVTCMDEIGYGVRTRSFCDEMYESDQP